MKKIIVLVVMLFCLSTTVFSFATLTAPASGDQIKFDTNVGDVDVYLNGAKIGRKDSNSFVYKVKRVAEDQVFTFKKEGYSDASVTLTKSLAPTFLLNVFVGGLLGSFTDSIFTKNNMEYSPAQYYVQLEKK